MHVVTTSLELDAPSHNATTILYYTNWETRPEDGGGVMRELSTSVAYSPKDEEEVEKVGRKGGSHVPMRESEGVELDGIVDNSANWATLTVSCRSSQTHRPC